MAYINPSDNQDEELKKQQDQESGSQAPVLGQQSGDLGSSTGAVGKPASQAPSSSGSYVNLQKYLNANADQSPSSALTQKLSQQGSAARSGLNQATQEFDSKVKSGSADVDQALIDKAFADPTGFVKDPNNVAAFQKQRTNSYAGPTSLNDLGDYDPSNAYNIADSVKEIKSEPGRYSLIQRYLSTPNYTTGEQNLDQLLLQNSPASKQDFANLESNYGGLGDEVMKAEAAAQQEAKDRKTQIGNAVSSLNSKGQSAESDIQSALSARMKDLAAQKVQQAAYLNAAIQARNGAPLGIAAGTATYKINPYDYLKSSQDPTANSIATADEQAKYAALSQLMGQQNSYLPDAGQVGTYDPSKAAYFDTNAFSNAVGDRQKLYNDELNNTYVNQANQTFTYPTQDSVKLTDALAQAKADADSARAALAAGDTAGAFQPSIDRYNELQKQLAALQSKWGANDKFTDQIKNPIISTPKPIYVKK